MRRSEPGILFSLFTLALFSFNSTIYMMLVENLHAYNSNWVRIINSAHVPVALLGQTYQPAGWSEQTHERIKRVSDIWKRWNS